MDNELKRDVEAVLNYRWSDEERHYQEQGRYPKAHIFRVLKRLTKRTDKHDSE